MNRRERRRMEGQMGLLKIKQHLPLAEKMRLQRERIARGKDRGEQYQNNVDVEAQKRADQKASENIYSRALTISTAEGIPFIDAMNRAKEELEKS